MHLRNLSIAARVALSVGLSATSTVASVARAQQLEAAWGRWLEHAGVSHFRLMVMTKDDLTLAAAERRHLRHDTAGCLTRAMTGQDE